MIRVEHDEGAVVQVREGKRDSEEEKKDQSEAPF